MPTNSLSIGSVLPGALLVQEQLGGQVFRVQRKHDGRELAVRIITPPLAASALALARAASGIRHPALAHIEAYGEREDGSVFIASELVRGPTLLAWRQQTAAPELAHMVETMRSLHGALEEASRAGVLHEAIHPGNVRLQPSTAGEPLKLLDIGVPPGVFAETRDVIAQRFIAPEASSASAGCTAAMNVYACGCLLYFLVTGELPDEALSAKTLPANLRAVVKRALATDPQDRFASVAELDAALAAATRSISQRASEPDSSSMRISGMGVAPIGLRSSSPPDLLSSYPPDDEAHDLAADSGDEEAPAQPEEKRTRHWPALALSAAAIAGVALLLVGRMLISPQPPASQGALAPKERHESDSNTRLRGLPLTAHVHVREIEVQGGAVPAALVKRAAVRLQSQFKNCYEESARAAGYNSFGELSVSLQIDAQGRARSAQVQGANLPQLDACITQGLSSMRSEGSKDSQAMLASFKIAFTP